MIAEADGGAKEDSVAASFLALLARDTAESPEKIKPLSATRKRRIEQLTKNIAVDLDDDLGAETLLY